jgi:hypothetical protein
MIIFVIAVVAAVVVAEVAMVGLATTIQYEMNSMYFITLFKIIKQIVILNAYWVWFLCSIRLC